MHIYVPLPWLEDELGEGHKNLSILSTESRQNQCSNMDTDRRSRQHAKMARASLGQGSRTVMMIYKAITD